MNIIQNLVKKFKKDKKNIPVLGIYLPDTKNSKNKKLKPIITGVDEAGPSHDVLKENDLILKINEKKINTLKDYDNAQKKLKPNEIIIIRLKRRNQELNRAIRTISLHEFENPRQKHFVRFDLYFHEGSIDTKVLAVGKKSVANKKIKSGDVILEINKEPIFNGSDYLKEIKKVLWGEEVLFTILRDKKKIYQKIKSNSFYEYKLRTVMFDVRTKLFDKKYLKVVKTQPLYSEGNLIKKGDIILSISAIVKGKQFKKKIN